MIRFWLKKLQFMAYFAWHREWPLLREEWKLTKKELDEAEVSFQIYNKIAVRRLWRAIQYLEMAREQQPRGRTCTFCGKDNTFADELGFFYINPDPAIDARGGHPCCEDCYNGEPGTKHRNRLVLDLISHGPLEMWMGQDNLSGAGLPAEKPE